MSGGVWGRGRVARERAARPGLSRELPQLAPLAVTVVADSDPEPADTRDLLRDARRHPGIPAA